MTIQLLLEDEYKKENPNIKMMFVMEEKVRLWNGVPVNYLVPQCEESVSPDAF